MLGKDKDSEATPPTRQTGSTRQTSSEKAPDKAKADEVGSPGVSRETSRDKKKDSKAKAVKDSSPDVSKETFRGELKEVKKDRDEYLDGWKRAKADLINYKGDELKRLEQVIQFANEDMIRDLITVLDSFELALASMKDNDPSEKGVYLIKIKLEECLKKRGLKKIEVETGDAFDPAYHEAVGVTEDKSAKSETVAEELGAGYILHEKVIRPAKVKVYK